MFKTDYNNQANNWKRDEAICPSDFFARPVAFDLFKEIGEGKIVVDIGCGEGYFSRKMAKIARKVIAFDNSKKMIEVAKVQNEVNKQNIEYSVADMMDMNFIEDSSVDICLCNFVVHYIHPDKFTELFKSIERILKPGGRLILCGPHPYGYVNNNIGGIMLYDDGQKRNYIDDRGKYFHLTIKTTKNTELKVGLHWATLSDYLKSIFDAGFKLEKFIEPVPKKEILEREYANLGPVDETPVYMILQALKL
jgi:SAM-dependent methyltransferase